MRVSVVALLSLTVAIEAQTLIPASVAPTTTSATSILDTQTTVSAAYIGAGYAGSVIQVDPCGATTVSLDCILSQYCNYYQPGVTMILEPSRQTVLFKTTEGAYRRTCVFKGPRYSATEATCRDITVAEDGGHKTTFGAFDSTTGSVKYETIAITANANALTSTQGVCTSTEAAAAPTATAVREMFKIVVPVGAAILAMG